MATLYAVRILDAVPPLVLTADADQVQTWRDTGAALAVYELDAVQTFPAPEPPVEEPPAPEPETPEETTP